MSKTVRTIVIVLMIVLFLFGLLYALTPVIQGMIQNRIIREGKRAFYENMGMAEGKERREIGGKELEIYSYLPEKAADLPYAELYTAMQNYNRELYQSGQESFSNSASWAETVFSLKDYGLGSEVFGTISIPKIEEELPIFLGANAENLGQGVAQLSNTSVPVGGKNTNCVIAGHRQWYGTKFFRNLDQVEIGDFVLVTNLWGTMIYRVTETKIVLPNASDEVKIQSGKDMITLLTCHPYASGGKYRLLVYCERQN